MNLYFKQSKYGHFCLIEKDLISNFINTHGFWEIHLYELYTHMINQTDIVLDAGANIGFNPIQFAKLANEGKVIAFEPQPLIYNVLTVNILYNGATDVVEQHKLGLSNKVKNQKMTLLSKQFFSKDCINYGGRGIADEGEEEVKTTTIDNLNLNTLDFIKMDIQGSELDAIKGGINTITKNKPIIFLENSKSKESGVETLKILKDIEYICYRLTAGNKEDCVLIDRKKHKDIKDIMENNKILYENEETIV